MTLGSNIKSIIPKTDTAKKLSKAVQNISNFESTNKSLASKLMATLTAMKFDDSLTIHEHFTEMSNFVARLRAMDMEVSE